ncbi:MAG: peptidoglycan binding domain-containing protein [Anaerococcus obesiensis]
MTKSIKMAYKFFSKESFEFDYKVNYDENKLEDILKNSQFMNKIVEPEDAKLEFDGKEFKIKRRNKGK